MLEPMTELTNRSQNSLRRLIYDIGPMTARGREADYPIDPETVARYSERDFAGLYNTGAKTIVNVKAWLADHGKTLKAPIEPPPKIKRDWLLVGGKRKTGG